MQYAIHLWPRQQGAPDRRRLPGECVEFMAAMKPGDLNLAFTFTFTFRAFGRRFYPKRLTKSTFVEEGAAIYHCGA